ncbi:MAG: hypothetical protein HY908_31775 [Myxococcales bacterium]|nr:hypothetical protein [Myxococcales bacterium]
MAFDRIKNMFADARKPASTACARDADCTAVPLDCVSNSGCSSVAIARSALGSYEASIVATRALCGRFADAKCRGTLGLASVPTCRAHVTKCHGGSCEWMRLEVARGWE